MLLIQNGKKITKQFNVLLLLFFLDPALFTVLLRITSAFLDASALWALDMSAQFTFIIGVTKSHINAPTLVKLTIFFCD